MKVNTLYTAGATITGVSIHYMDAQVANGVANTITPTIRGVAVRYETDGTANTITNTVVSESGLVQDQFYFQFSEYLADVFSYCPDQSFSYPALTVAQALYVEMMFAGVQSSLTAGVATATPKGVKSMKTPVGSSIELFDGVETGSRNAEILQPIVAQVGKTLCGTTSAEIASFPLFSAFGLRVEQAECETIIDVSTPVGL